ncbi:MAG: M20/M25/M40 family metallo-hydrolase [Acidobacteriota bacterium]|nr:M20/M25/M40 family metallo-hydrolase [Acidobacteriota bacterium]
MKRQTAGLLLSAVLLAASTDQPQNFDAISADSLRANLSYLASDELEGRGTPSHGLDLAAQYIAAQFKRAGLEPAAPDYFQNAKFTEATVDMNGFRLTLDAGGKHVSVAADQVQVRSLEPLDLTGAPVMKLPANGAIPAVTGRIVAGDERRYGDEIFLNELKARKPALILLIGRGRFNRRETATFLEDADGVPPVIRIRRSEAAAWVAKPVDLALSVHLAKPLLHEATLRNVAGILRGSDPGLRDSFFLVTAHYDHLGRNARGIFHGANDNASGTASVIEIARALASANPHPARSIVFIAFFGEEEGLLGSYYYARHPLFPLKSTVADINLEQLGRTDDPGGRRIAEFAITGESYSDVAGAMAAAAKTQGVNVYSRRDGDAYFNRSDNYSFAQYGVVSHTIAVAFEYPDYHAFKDQSEKIDYPNMATVDRGIAAGVLALANRSEPPEWSSTNAATVYREAGK